MTSWTTEIRTIESVGGNMVAIELWTPDGFEARPGQFILVRGPTDNETDPPGGVQVPSDQSKPIGRHYTISSPDTIDTFEITVKRDPEGTLTPWLTSRRPTDQLVIEGPFGHTFYEAGDVVVIAGGPGIGAAVGIGERGVREGYEVTIVYEGPPAHDSRLAKLATHGTVFVVTHHLPNAVRTALDHGHVFVIGFRDFIDRVRKAMTDAGVDPDSASYENYGNRLPAEEKEPS